MTVKYVTNTLIPLEAFQKFGINVKPNSKSPFGFFGTGLKYALAVILREGGSFRLFRDGVEYEFYLKALDFRGKEFGEVRMRKRTKSLRWARSVSLPFTTELGKNWKLWQAHRELESNTRDEGGFTKLIDEPRTEYHKGTTVIIIDCPGFDDVVKDTEIFLPENIKEEFEYVETDMFFAYKNRPAKSLYYQGIRVYDTKNPTTWTYDFKPGFISLTEDRALADVWIVQYHLSQEIKKFEAEDLKLLFPEEGEPSFEADDLSYYNTDKTSPAVFNSVARSSRRKSLVGYTAVYLNEPVSKNVELKLSKSEVETVIQALRGVAEEDLAQKIQRQIEEVPF